MAKPTILNQFATFIVSVLLLCCCTREASSKIVALVDSESWGSKFSEGISDYRQSSRQEVSFDYQPIVYTNSSQDEAVCQVLSNGVAIVLDFTPVTHFSEGNVRKILTEKQVPFFKVEFPLDTMIRGFDAMLQKNDGSSNGYLIFQNDIEVDRAIHIILGNTLIRYAFLNFKTMGDFIREKFEHRIPSATVVFGNHDDFTTFVADMSDIVRDYTEWLFLYDTFTNDYPILNISFPYLRGQYDQALCCSLRNPGVGGGCTPASCTGPTGDAYARRLGYIVAEALGQSSLATDIRRVPCDDTSAASDNGAREKVATELGAKSQNIFTVSENRLVLNANIGFYQVNNTKVETVGEYSTSENSFALAPEFSFRVLPTFYRIGIVEFPPWTYKEDGVWKGYCIDLADEIARNMNFTYDLVESDGFGRRDNLSGRWDGLTGDLIHGRVDIAIAAYIMTSEREEFIDFVSPYYEQSGLIITMKRQEVKNSLFKFMTVLRAEVWLSIAGATVSTGFMLWFLDKFSPYSAQNNPHKYKSFRKFTLKESFWFALTSFTPQGGGEPPKAFSGRTLVAAYWIFVVLMLATFTANLAAFLTVERMQSPIRNLEHLAAQSSVKYSVAANSTALNFFKNMANAEETLYQMWRNLTLNAPSSAKEYIVWEYPIREMYIHIYSVILKNEPVVDYDTGFQRAMNDEYFAFIHDAAQTRYHVYRNCNLTLIGEPFAEAPYAIAVQQGNPLQDNISMAILQLQTARFFETLSGRYWSPVCNAGSEGESDGISLESLGGVFIATIIGLGIAFISLAIEVFTTNRNRMKAKVEAKNMMQPSFVGPLDFYGATKKAEAFKGTFLPEVTH